MDLGGLIRSIDWNFLENTAMRLFAVLLSLTVHEACHGLAACALGDPTARERRRLSLNPLRHIDWLGLAMLLTVGFGWARPVPVDPRYFKKPRRGMALTALAGPASNFALAFVEIAAARAAAGPAASGAGPAYELYIFLLYHAAPLSIALGLFNLLPVPPLDGAKVLGAFLPERTYFGLMRYERYGMLLLLALSWLGFTGNLLNRAVWGIWTGFTALL